MCRKAVKHELNNNNNKWYISVVNKILTLSKTIPTFAQSIRLTDDMNYPLRNSRIVP